MCSSNSVYRNIYSILLIPLLLYCSLGTGDLFAATQLVGKVSHVIDGDSIMVKKGRKKYEVRLWGIDAPEYGQNYGAEAKKMTTRLLKGKKVAIEVKAKDSYNRLVGVVYLNGKNINGELVKSASAWVYSRYCKDSICSNWKSIEKKNKRKRKGLWRTQKPMPPWVWRRSKAK